ncbi:AraC family transcriptional regulator [Lachnospiraceae bacterium OttesenSCG-928-D06]|nr:AraC family transcriptional regulator [Lachnospiraceae bacterium OttesenSCG-928-D06]
MKIYYCGREDCEKGHSFGPAVRHHYLIHFVLEGKGTFKTAEGVFPIEEGQAFLIRPEEITYYKADVDNPWRYAWVAFDGEDGAELLARYYPDVHYPVGTVALREESVKWLFELIASFNEKLDNVDRVLGYFYLLMSCFEKKQAAFRELDERSHYKKGVFFIKNNYSYQIQIKEVADFVGIDRTYLYKIFMRQSGMSPKQYLSEYRLIKAKDMLQNTLYQITEIAYSCGYHDSSSFCRYFQKALGVTPAKYRKNVTEMHNGLCEGET